MKQMVTLLAVTRMRSGFCLAGIEAETGRWVRPVKEFGSLQRGDMYYADRAPLSVYDQVELALLRPRPQPPHVEDWTCDFVRERPRRAGRLTGAERAAFLERAAEENTSPLLRERFRSLMLAGADDLAVTFSCDAATGKLEARLLCPVLGLTAPVAVTDLRWRALGRARYAGYNGRPIPWAQLRADLGLDRVYLALGLSREWEGRLWPLVIGVHTVPDYEATADLLNP